MRLEISVTAVRSPLGSQGALRGALEDVPEGGVACGARGDIGRSRGMPESSWGVPRGSEGLGGVPGGCPLVCTL